MWSVLWRFKEFCAPDALPSCGCKVVVTFKFSKHLAHKLKNHTVSWSVRESDETLCLSQEETVLSVYTWGTSKLTLSIQILPGQIATPMIFFTTKARKRERFLQRLWEIGRNTCPLGIACFGIVNRRAPSWESFSLDFSKYSSFVWPSPSLNLLSWLY